MTIKNEKWGTMPDGRQVDLYTLTNSKGMQATVTTYGATLVGLTASDRNGVLADVVLGYDSANAYINGRGYFGATVGRVANRLSQARFELDGVTHEVSRNKEYGQLHGGGGGFHSKLWAAEPVETFEGASLVLGYNSADGEEGYPGNLDVSVVYTLTEQGLRLEYRAETDAPTVVTLTNHAYFNLGGIGASIGDVLDHVVTLNASRYLVTDANQVPTGEVADVAGTPLDFSRPNTIGLRINDSHDALQIGHGYDHYFIIDGPPGELNQGIQVFHSDSGRVLDVLTTQPGLQFYTGNHMPERTNGKFGSMYGVRSGFCVETQGYVDAPNQSEFPSIVLRPGEKYEQVTEYRFSVM